MKELKSHRAQVEYLLDSVEGLREGNEKLLLMLLYWKVFDGLNIPPDITKEILRKATSPETIFRSMRHVNSEMLLKHLDEDSNASAPTLPR